MRRGEVWTVTTRRGDPGRSHTVVIVQDDRFDATTSVTVCALTTDPTTAPLLRLPVTPDPDNGLPRAASLTIDKITTIPRTRLSQPLGHLGDDDMTRLGRALMVFVGLGG